MNSPKHLLPPREGQLVILLADDDPLVRNMVRIALEGEGYCILTAADGEEALQLSRTFPAVIHLLLSDVEMPKLDGLQLRERLREERPATEVLLMSGELALAAEQGLRKPFSLDVLKERVRQLLRTSRKALQLEGKNKSHSAA